MDGAWAMQRHSSAISSGCFVRGAFTPGILDLAREELARLAVSKAIRLPQVQTESEIASAARATVCHTRAADQPGRKTDLH
jgi:hypothetical protein